jgi:hypothetical protein
MSAADAPTGTISSLNMTNTSTCTSNCGRITSCTAPYLGKHLRLQLLQQLLPLLHLQLHVTIHLLC